MTEKRKQPKPERPGWVEKDMPCRVYLNEPRNEWVDAVVIRLHKSSATVQYKLAPLFSEESTVKRVGWEKIRRL